MKLTISGGHVSISVKAADVLTVVTGAALLVLFSRAGTLQRWKDRMSKKLKDQLETLDTGFVTFGEALTEELHEVQVEFEQANAQTDDIDLQPTIDKLQNATQLLSTATQLMKSNNPTPATETGGSTGTTTAPVPTNGPGTVPAEGADAQTGPITTGDGSAEEADAEEEPTQDTPNSTPNG